MNDDLISRQAALRQKFTSYYTNGAEIRQIEAVPVREIEKLPAVDAVPVVRCKDCKHNPKLEWFGCPMASLSEKQRPETAWCWKGEHHG